MSIMYYEMTLEIIPSLFRKKRKGGKASNDDDVNSSATKRAFIITSIRETPNIKIIKKKVLNASK